MSSKKSSRFKSKKVAPKARKKKSPIDTDDAIEIGEAVFEELTGLGLTKRLAIKVRNIAAKDLLEKIRELTKENRELTKMAKEMSDVSKTLVKNNKDKDSEISQLKSQIKKLKKARNKPIKKAR